MQWSFSICDQKPVHAYYICTLSALSFTEDSVEDILQVLILFGVETLELDFALLFPDRHVLLRVLPVLVVLATSSEKDSESLYKRVKINRLINIFKVCKILSFINILVTCHSKKYFLSSSNVEWSSCTRLSRPPSISSCNFERIVDVLPEVLCTSSSSQSSSNSWAPASWSTRISFTSLSISLIFYYVYRYYGLLTPLSTAPCPSKTLITPYNLPSI